MGLFGHSILEVAPGLRAKVELEPALRKAEAFEDHRRRVAANEDAVGALRQTARIGLYAAALLVEGWESDHAELPPWPALATPSDADARVDWLMDHLPSPRLTRLAVLCIRRLLLLDDDAGNSAGPPGSPETGSPASETPSNATSAPPEPA